MEYERGKLLAEGKTKKIYSVSGQSGLCIVESKDDITAGDGARHDVVRGKGALANQITCDVFALLKQEEAPLAFIKKFDDKSFLAEYCEMLPWEVVVRGKAWGSYLKRYPNVPQGHEFYPVLVEFFLKTSGKRWEEHELPEDDPFAVIHLDGSIELFNPKLAMNSQIPFLTVHKVAGWDRVSQMYHDARTTFLALKRAWKRLGGDLIDFKIEFGITADARVLVSDVIDTESWRLLGPDGRHLDKQPYRDGASPEEVVQALYGSAAGLTKRFISFGG